MIGVGRTKARRVGVKLETLTVGYWPQLDTVLKAYVRLLAARAEAAAAEEASMAQEWSGGVYYCYMIWSGGRGMLIHDTYPDVYFDGILYVSRRIR